MIRVLLYKAIPATIEAGVWSVPGEPLLQRAVEAASESYRMGGYRKDGPPWPDPDHAIATRIANDFNGVVLTPPRVSATPEGVCD